MNKAKEHAIDMGSVPQSSALQSGSFMLPFSFALEKVNNK
jgi:hypothetical protein